MTKPSPAPPPIARVDIRTNAGHISVEAAVPLATVKKAALDLWRATVSPSVPPADSDDPALPPDLTRRRA